jgi:hypothetical protein
VLVGQTAVKRHSCCHLWLQQALLSHQLLLLLLVCAPRPRQQQTLSSAKGRQQR